MIVRVRKLLKFFQERYEMLVAVPLAYIGGIFTAKWSFGWKIDTDSASVIGAFAGSAAAVGGAFWLWHFQQTKQRRVAVLLLRAVFVDVEAECNKLLENYNPNFSVSGPLPQPCRKKFEDALRGSMKKLIRLESLITNLGPNTANRLLSCEQAVTTAIEELSAIRNQPLLERIAAGDEVIAVTDELQKQIQLLLQKFTLVVGKSGLPDD